MRRWLVAVLLCILVPSAVSVYLFIPNPWTQQQTSPSPPFPTTTVTPSPTITETPSPNPTPTSTPTPSSSPLVVPKVGVFYYVWYGAPNSDDWNASKFVDYPVLGNYSSSDLAVIKQQLVLMKEAGIDFVVISWWGYDDGGNDYKNFVDNAAQTVLQVAEDNMINLKFAIMVEPFNTSGTYDYSGIYSHIYDNFVAPYSSLYYYNGSQPVICFFNDQNLTDNGNIPKDERFNTILVGQQSYTQWVYTDADIYDLPAHEPCNQTSVTPRYDESRLPDRPMHFSNDSDLTQGLYDREWEKAIQLWKDGRTDTIMITSWNEYPERTAIEPHIDATAINRDPYLLYNKTKAYINQIHQLTAASYLKSHFNETVGLIYESEDTGTPNIPEPNYNHDQIYYIYSDNLLAEWALKPYEPQISNEINQTVQSYNIPPSKFFEVLFGKPIPINMSNATQLVIKQNLDYIILAEFHNSSTPLLWDQYGDTLIYQSLNSYLKGNRTEADDYFFKAYNMWGGKGIYDLATQNEKTYANYKLALILYASKVLNLTIGNYNQIEEKLWSMQQSNGGITSLADLNGNPTGSANAETTAMALLPYNYELILMMQSLFGSY